MSLGYLTSEGAIQGNDYSAVRANMKVDAKITIGLNLEQTLIFRIAQMETLLLVQVLIIGMQIC
jgi:hypothetical protein